MFRRLVILLFILAAFGNSLGAAALVSEEQCGACCRQTNTQQQQAGFSKVCCYSECGEPGESTPRVPKGVVAAEPKSKTDAPVSDSFVEAFETQSLTTIPAVPRQVVSSTHLYLKTGTLLI